MQGIIHIINKANTFKEFVIKKNKNRKFEKREGHVDNWILSHPFPTMTTFSINNENGVYAISSN